VGESEVDVKYLVKVMFEELMKGSESAVNLFQYHVESKCMMCHLKISSQVNNYKELRAPFNESIVKRITVNKCTRCTNNITISMLDYPKILLLALKDAVWKDSQHYPLKMQLGAHTYELFAVVFDSDVLLFAKIRVDYALDALPCIRLENVESPNEKWVKICDSDRPEVQENLWPSPRDNWRPQILLYARDREALMVSSVLQAIAQMQMLKERLVEIEKELARYNRIKDMSQKEITILKQQLINKHAQRQ